MLFHDCDTDCQDYKDKDHAIPNRWRIGEFGFNRCPFGILDKDFYYWRIFYSMFKNGFLPNEGGFLNQANKYIEFMFYMDIKLKEYEAEQYGK